MEGWIKVPQKQTSYEQVYCNCLYQIKKKNRFDYKTIDYPQFAQYVGLANQEEDCSNRIRRLGLNQGFIKKIIPSIFEKKLPCRYMSL